MDEVEWVDTREFFRVIIAGSRDLIMPPDKIFPRIDRILSKKEHIVVLSGGARGADKLGEKWAMDNCHTLQVHEADWQTHGRSAGYRRNSEMAEQADALIAIWDGKSKGTKHMIDIAKGRGLGIRIINTSVQSNLKHKPFNASQLELLENVQ